jgi:hypothetical protein
MTDKTALEMLFAWGETGHGKRIGEVETALFLTYTGVSP